MVMHSGKKSECSLLTVPSRKESVAFKNVDVGQKTDARLSGQVSELPRLWLGIVLDEERSKLNATAENVESCRSSPIILGRSSNGGPP